MNKNLEDIVLKDEEYSQLKQEQNSWKIGHIQIDSFFWYSVLPHDMQELQVLQMQMADTQE